MDNNKRFRRKYWGYVLIWVGCIYSTLYIVRPICEFLKKAIPFSLFTNLILGLILFIVISGLLIKIRIKRPFTYFLFLTAVLLYIYSFIQIQYPEEKIHFAEYGLLAFLVYKALCIDFKKGLAFVGAFVLTSLFGWGDEGIQYLLPNRYYQFSDVLLNSWSGVLGLFLTYIFVSENKSKT